MIYGVAKFEVFLYQIKLCNHRAEEEEEGACDRSLQLAHSTNLSTTTKPYPGI